MIVDILLSDDPDFATYTEYATSLSIVEDQELKGLEPDSGTIQSGKLKTYQPGMLSKIQDQSVSIWDTLT